MKRMMKDSNVKKILIVDDSPTIRDMIVSILSQSGHNYELFEATNGLEAVARLNSESMDLIITDIVMPKMDGFELINEIRRIRNLEIPIIVMTGDEQYIDVFRIANLLEPNDFLSKDTIQKRLLSMVTGRLGRGGEE